MVCCVGRQGTENERQFYTFVEPPKRPAVREIPGCPRHEYEKEGKLTRYYVIRSAQDTETARRYLEQNLEVDELRVILVREELTKGDYVNAERLCQEWLEKEQVGQQC